MEGQSARIRFILYRDRGANNARTFRRVQRAAVSEADTPSHARVNSKSVCGGDTGTDVGTGRDGSVDEGADDADADPDPRVVDTCLCGCAGSFGAGVGAGASHALKKVSFSDMRKIPPPTCPAFFSSRTCFASLNDVDSDFGVVPASAVGADDTDLGSRDVESMRELMGLKRSFVGSVFAGASESTMVMGTRRRFGGATAEGVDDTGGGVEMSMGAVRCTTGFVVKHGEIRTR